MPRSLFALLLTVGFVCYTGGCGPAEVEVGDDSTAQNGGDGHDHDHDHDHGDHGHDHDHDHGDGDGDHPETYAAAVEELAELNGKIKAAMAEDDLKKADGPVHAVGHILEEVEELAAVEEFSDEQKQTVETAVETLFEAFGDFDKTIHGKNGKSWDEVTGDIDGAIKSLQDVGQAASADE